MEKTVFIKTTHSDRSPAHPVSPGKREMGTKINPGIPLYLVAIQQVLLNQAVFFSKSGVA